MNSHHNLFMHRCLQLAASGFGMVAPNPMVGAVVVFENSIIGEGWHRHFGGPHAEVNAIHAVHNPEVLAQSTLYVSLEPCSHHGKTPPCADLIIQHKIPRVVVACLDPNPLVAGRGLERLRNAGVEVIEGVLTDEAEFLNRRFLTFHQHKRSYVLLKWAETADGFVDLNSGAEGPLKITSAAMDTLVHHWRANEMAIMVGKNTVLRDNPSLTVRHVKGPDPIRVVIDARLEVPRDAKVFASNAKVIVINTLKNATEGHVEFVQVPETSPQAILQVLFERHVLSVIIEGGPALQRSFIECGLWDEARKLVGPMRVGHGIAAPMLPGSANYSVEVMPDVWHTYFHPKVGFAQRSKLSSRAMAASFLAR